MKIHLLLFFTLIVCLLSCDEIPPVVTGSMGPVEPPGISEQQRQVLIEEFTGVRCVNCPDGSAHIEELLVANAPQLIAVSIHAGSFSPPYPQNLYDFRTAEGDAILNYVGQPIGFPTAVVNRRKFDGSSTRQLGQPKWAGKINEEKAIPPKVKIAIEPEFDATTREVKAKITLVVQENISDPGVHLSVMITETGIVDYQLTEESPEPVADYVHKHVLRGMMTPYDGIPITETLTSGAQVVKNVSYDLPAGWKEENCKIVAFVSLSGTEKDVLQAHEVEVLE